MSPETHDQASEYDLITTSAPVDERTQILKLDDTFGVFDRFGDVEPLAQSHLGLYRGDTRYLSRLRLRLENERPLLLDSTVSRDNAVFRVDMMNLDIRRGDELVIPHGTVHLLRTKAMGTASCLERVIFHNYSLEPVEFVFSVEFGADFADIFEIRGLERASRGAARTPEAGDRELRFVYEGLDGTLHLTRVALDVAPEWRGEGRASYQVRLPAHGEAAFGWTVSCEMQGRGERPLRVNVGQKLAESVPRLRESGLELPEIVTSNQQFNDWVARSAADIGMLISSAEGGPYPFAGVPWFSTPFGRDGIITALECLWADPGLARGVLEYLALTQADALDASRDAQPGRIIHESRCGEMAATGEVPFGRYYGSVDATPLFVMLSGAYFERTHDIPFAEWLWPYVERALAWIDDYGDEDADGFVEYARLSAAGLLNQGWKDSHDSVFHADGSLADGPIALCEVQGYVYSARRAAGRLAQALGRRERAAILTEQAEQLRQRFEDTFWCDELGTYALALDGDKRPCRVVTSNAGHCLLTGIASDERAHEVVRTLSGADCFTGWGIRTVSARERRFNPMSYHNGSVWPHDNAICAAGMARYGLKGAAINVLTGLFDASLYFDLHRLPELFCGFPRLPDQAPTLYPVACSPQAWAAGSVFLALQAALGMRVTAADSTVAFTDPVLPVFCDWMEIRGLHVGEARIDLALTRRIDQAVVSVSGRDGPVRVVTVK